MSSGSFRLQSKDLFLTYPQCDARPGDVYTHLRTVLKNLTCAAICRERHESGDPHLHAIVQLAKRCDFHSPNCLDIPNGHGGVFHGNYQPVRNKRACFDYITKDGEVEFFNTDMEACRTYYRGITAKRKLGEAFEQLREGRDIAELFTDTEFQTCAIMHQDKLMKALSAVKVWNALKLKKKFVSAQSVSGGLPSMRIAGWLNHNLMKERPFAQKQLYVHGPTMHGKTTLVNQLRMCLRTYFVPTGEDFYDHYDDSRYDLIVIDEFKSQKTIQWMNMFLDGSVMPLKQKGKQVVKEKNLPVIVLSNYSLRDAYHRCEDTRLETLERRFEIVELTEPIALDISTVDV